MVSPFTVSQCKAIFSRHIKNLKQMTHYWFRERMFSTTDATSPLHLPFIHNLAPNSSDLLKQIRTQALSGRYQGKYQNHFFELRIDIDMVSPHSQVLNIVSGDVFREIPNNLAQKPNELSRVYLRSWKVEHPNINWFNNEVEISGRMRYALDEDERDRINIKINWGAISSAPSMIVKVWYGHNSHGMIFQGAKVSNTFRTIELEIDVCESVKSVPITPLYNTHDHPFRPLSIVARDLSIEEALLDTGVTIKIDDTPSSIIDDSTTTFRTWSAEELHHIMKDHYAQTTNSPQWKMWGLLAGSFEKGNVAGIMFDTKKEFKSGINPNRIEREGFAIFKNHRWFKHLTNSYSHNRQAYASRQFLYTWIHEIGHTLNLIHSWEKNRPSALSWMNSSKEYNKERVGNFWRDFDFQFDVHELQHIRHGARHALIMGGADWAGDHASTRLEGIHYQAIGGMPIQLKLKSKRIFEYLEPVAVEIRLKNLLPYQITIDKRLEPEHGNVVILIQNPSGRVLNYHPIKTYLSSTEKHKLGSARTKTEGKDRLSEQVLIFYGKDGFYFDTPGTYKVKAIYNFRGIPIPSNLLPIRVGLPLDKTQEQLAQDYFNSEVGESIALEGSKSPLLSDAMDKLREVKEKSPKSSALSTKISTILAQSEGKDFHKITKNINSKKITRIHESTPEKFLKLSKVSLKYYQKNEDEHNNLAYNKLVRARVKNWSKLGEKTRVKEELKTLKDSLCKRGVNTNILKEISQFKKRILSGISKE